MHAALVYICMLHCCMYTTKYMSIHKFSIIVINTCYAITLYYASKLRKVSMTLFTLAFLIQLEIAFCYICVY